MLESIFKAIGGVVGDTVEVVKTVGEEIIDAPGHIIDGFNEGLMITPDGVEATEGATPSAAPVEAPQPVAASDLTVEQLQALMDAKQNESSFETK